MLPAAGCFPRGDVVSAAVVDHVRGCLELPDAVAFAHDSDRTLRHHRGLTRSRLGVAHEPEQVRRLAEGAIREAAQAKDNPADLSNTALEELVRRRDELPGYTTPDELTARTRSEVNTGLFATIGARLTTAGRDGFQRLLAEDPATP